MKAINKHGLKINGLKKASGCTENYWPYSGNYVEIFYNKYTGCVWGNFHHDLWYGITSVYADPDIVMICRTTNHMTMQEIADAIHDRLKNCM